MDALPPKTCPYHAEDFNEAHAAKHLALIKAASKRHAPPVKDLSTPSPSTPASK